MAIGQFLCTQPSRYQEFEGTTQKGNTEKSVASVQSSFASQGLKSEVTKVQHLQFNPRLAIKTLSEFTDPKSLQLGTCDQY